MFRYRSVYEIDRALVAAWNARVPGSPEPQRDEHGFMLILDERNRPRSVCCRETDKLNVSERHCRIGVVRWSSRHAALPDPGKLDSER